MQAKCFACETVVEAPDVNGVAEAFLTHGRESHAWSYPEPALRNYARNYAEAVDRHAGATDRLPSVGDVTVNPVTEDRVDDWLHFFDHDGFAGNLDWASCYLPRAAHAGDR